jgi:hypothetical protein
MDKVKLKASRKLMLIIFILTLVLSGFIVPTTLSDFFFPGSQPEESGVFESPDKCNVCHGGYDLNTEPVFNWTGSMMAQAARDPLYEACMTISNQDVAFSGDLCIRCHSPEGWLGGRSTPTDGSALTASDIEGIHCDFCHRLVRLSEIGVNPYPLDQFYTDNTYPADQKYLNTITSIPSSPGNGSYIVDTDNSKRGPFTDAGAKHKLFYSPYHSQSAMCGTCHDVSNPVYSRNSDGTYSANPFDQPAPSYNTYDLFPVERTYSEWLMSDYNTSSGVYAPQFGGNKQYVSTCQDCHLRDISGVAANKTSAVFRNDLPYHDMTGGNTFAPLLIKTLFPSINKAALDSGINRARYMLKNAASLELNVNTNLGNLTANVKVTNETGHKLPSGYPEGRRIWINLVAYDISGSVLYESGHYDFENAVLEIDDDIKVYEIKPGIDETIASLTGTESGPGFHFVLNNIIFSDNRIPPRGFTNANFQSIQSPPVAYSYEDGQYWDETVYILPETTISVKATLFYQAVSKEYIDFLKEENKTNNSGQILYDLWSANGKSAPEIMNRVEVNVSPTRISDDLVSSVSVFPNPSHDWVKFRFENDGRSKDLRLSVVDLRGTYVVRSVLLPLMKNEAIFYIGNLKPGQYFFVIDNKISDQKFTGKFLIR